MSVSHVALGLVLIAGLYVLERALKDRRQRKGIPYPPGPNALTAYSILKTELVTPQPDEPAPIWKQRVDVLGEKYGGMAFASVMGQNILMLDNLDDAIELLDRRASIYSSRLQSTMLVDVCHGEGLVGDAPYGPTWRQRRRLIHGTMNKSVVGTFDLRLQEQADKLVHRLLEDPRNLNDNLRLAVGSVVLDSTYGIAVKDGEDPLLKMNEKGFPVVFTTRYGQYIVDLFPSLRHLPSWTPFLQFHKAAANYKKITSDMLNVPFDYVEQRMASGDNYPDSLTSMLCEEGTHDKEDIKYASGSIYIAASGTTMITVLSIMQAMIINPDVQRKVYEEMQSILGSHDDGSLMRSPTFEEKGKLVYLDAVIKEAMRWQVGLPFCPAHTTTENDIYKGYFIPKDTVVQANLWAISRNEKHYDSPEEFRPERFLGDNQQLDPHKWVFGFGRRICPGMFFAEEAVWIFVATILGNLELRAPRDEKGNAILPTLVPGHAFRPLPFDCDFIPRGNTEDVEAN